MKVLVSKRIDQYYEKEGIKFGSVGQISVGVAKKVWELVYGWIKEEWVLGTSVEHSLDIHLSLVRRRNKEIWSVFWHATI